MSLTPSIWMEAARPLISSTDPWPITLQTTGVLMQNYTFTNNSVLSLAILSQHFHLNSSKLPKWRCPRAVSTVLCVHERLCQPEDCSEHGRCVEGQCVCQQGWSGPGCANLTCQAECGEHGICTESESLSCTLLYITKGHYGHTSLEAFFLCIN